LTGAGWRGGVIALCALVTLIPPRPATAQDAQPTKFTVEDFQKLRWLAGRWMGTAPGEKPFYESYRFTSDSTIAIAFSADSAFSETRGTARIYLSVGRIYQASGSDRWVASRLDEHGVHFIPEANASNTFSWSPKSDDAWTATVRSGMGAQEQVTIYQMRRIR
jgi:hypothetical protein